MRLASSGSAASRPDRAGQRLRIAGGHEERARFVAEKLARSGCVRGDERCSAGDRLKRFVGDDAACLAGRSEDAERATGLPDLVRQLLVLDPGHVFDVRGRIGKQSVELAAADDAEADVGCQPRCGEDRLDALERNQLADEERDELVCHLPARLEEPLFSADEAHGNVVETGELCEEAGLGLRVRDHDVGGAERVAVDALERTCCERSRWEAASVGDERVGERHERVEHDRAAARGTAR